MIFRFDFVTNSSPSNYISYNIKNKKLYDYIESLGIKIKSKGEGILDDGMELILPSSLVGKLDDSGEIGYSWISFISDFVMETIQQSILSDYPEPDEPPEDWTEYEDEMIEKYREELDSLLPSFFTVSGMDEDIESAHIENENGTEGEFNVSEIIDVKDGIKKVKIPKKSLWTGEVLDSTENLGPGFDFEPGELLTQKWVNGRWETVSEPLFDEQSYSEKISNEDGSDSITNLAEKIKSMSTDEAKEYLVELLTQDIISNDDFSVLYQQLDDDT